MDDLHYYVPNVHFEQIPIKNLVSNQDYQRNLSQAHIAKAAAHFDLYQINPVRIIFINDSILSITHDTGDPLEPGDGFYYYKYFDKYAGVTVYQITDWEPAKFNRDKYYLADLYSYSRKKGV